MMSLMCVCVLCCTEVEKRFMQAMLASCMLYRSCLHSIVPSMNDSYKFRTKLVVAALTYQTLQEYQVLKTQCGIGAPYWQAT